MNLSISRKSIFCSLALAAGMTLLNVNNCAQALESPQLPKAMMLNSDKSAAYYSFPCFGSAKAHLIVFDTNSKAWQLRPFISDKTKSTSLTAQEQKAIAAINAGFFNLSDGVSASYLTINGKEVANPRTNKALIENPKLKPYLEAIYNRSEIRFYKNSKNVLTLDVVTHNSPMPKGLKLLHSLQGGPQLLPTDTSEIEAFIRTNPDGTPADSIGTRKPAARTAFGITKDGKAMLLCVAGKGQDPESSGVTLAQIAELLKSLGCDKAINLDGGASTTMYAKIPAMAEVMAAEQTQIQDAANAGAVSKDSVCGKNPETRVKSILGIVKK